MRNSHSLLFRERVLLHRDLNDLSIIVVTVVLEVQLLFASMVGVLLLLSEAFLASLLCALEFGLELSLDSLAGLLADDGLLTADLLNTVDVAAESLSLLHLSEHSVVSSLSLLDLDSLQDSATSFVVSLSPLLSSLKTSVSQSSVLIHQLNSLLFSSDEFLSQSLSGGEISGSLKSLGWASRTVQIH